LLEVHVNLSSVYCGVVTGLRVSFCPTPSVAFVELRVTFDAYPLIFVHFAYSVKSLLGMRDLSVYSVPLPPGLVYQPPK